MSWAMRRRGVVMTVIIVILSLIGIWGYFAFLHNAPSCSDYLQNQNETGIDCGGVCERMCAPDLAPPQVTFVRPVASGPGRTDVIAYIENPNLSTRIEDAKYLIELYDAENVLVASKEGMVDLLPKRTPLFVPNFFSGSATSLRAFLTIDETSLQWFTYEDTRATLIVKDIVVEHPDTLPRIHAVLENPSTNAYRNVRVIITVFDEKNNAIAASQTVVQQLRPEGEAELVFTWSAPFTGTPARQEILSILPEPS